MAGGVMMSLPVAAAAAVAAACCDAALSVSALAAVGHTELVLVNL